MVDMHLSSPDEQYPDVFIDKAKSLVRDIVGPEPSIYVVWFCKTLQNWKALLSTSIADGKYYELTYNGDKAETYVDVYVKESNTAVKD